MATLTFEMNRTTVLAQAFKATRNRTIDLVAPLHKEDFVPQVAAFASPPKWHLAHTTWFFEEMILKHHVPDYQEFDPMFGYCFNSYYQSLGERAVRAQRGNLTRPGVDRVLEYRRYVDQHMEQLLQRENQEVETLVVLGINHEQQHQELLLTDLKYAFSMNPLFPVYDGVAWVDTHNKEEGWVSVSEGIYEVGYQGEGFHFDNELGRHRVFVDDFELSKGLVTNAEFMEFINDGGYRHFKYWLDEGWSWVHENNLKAPLYWHWMDGQWKHYTLNGIQPVHPTAILSHISFYEAQAFATWKGCRLPTEFEWEIASDRFQWGDRWEWTYSAYLPYPGFQVAEGAVGEYNGKFMVNQMVLRGASVATAKEHSRPTYRNFFHPQMQWQFSGIRLAK